jgi:hypothetical protein
MIHLVILTLAALLAWQTVILVGRVIWLAVLIVAWCLLACITATLAAIVGCQKLSEIVDEWRWRRRYGEVLPPE